MSPLALDGCTPKRPSAQQPGDAEDLALAQREGYVPQRTAGGADLGLEAQVLHAQHFVAELRLALGEHIVDLAADHHGDDLVAVGLPGRAAADVLTVAQHHQAVGDLKDLLHAVGDVDDGHALGGELADHLEKLLRLRPGDG